MNNHTNKIVLVIAYLLQKEGKMNYLKIIKLIFFADKLHIKKYWRLITDDSYYAMDKWPVASLTLNIIKEPEQLAEWLELPFTNEGYDLRVTKPISDFDRLSEVEKETLDLIYARFNQYDQRHLVGLTHNYIEWQNLKQEVDVMSRAQMDIKDFFQDSENQDPIFNIPKEEVDLAKDLYLEREQYAI